MPTATEKPLSIVQDADGHTITRLTRNRLVITNTNGTEIAQADATKIAAWYWSKVGQRHTADTPNDPQP